MPSVTPYLSLYRVSFPMAAGSIGCQVGGCKGQAMTHINLRIHFMHRHVQDTLVILEERNCPHPHCLACDMLVPWSELNHHQPAMSLCIQVKNRKRRRLLEEEAWEGTVTSFWAYDRPLEIVSSFKYLRILLTATKNDWLDAIANIWKASNIWYYLA